MKETLVREQYNEQASIYDRRWSNYINTTLSFLQSWTEIANDEIVLDIACGTGELEKFLLQKNPEQRITGVDISEEMLNKARQKLSVYSQVSWQTARATELPFGDRSFDVVMCASAFHYFDDPLASLIEMKRVLKPDGRVVILDWCKDYWGCQILDLVLKFTDSAYQHCYTQKEFHDLLTEAGFQISRDTKFRHGILWEFMVAEIEILSS